MPPRDNRIRKAPSQRGRQWQESLRIWNSLVNALGAKTSFAYHVNEPQQSKVLTLELRMRRRKKRKHTHTKKRTKTVNQCARSPLLARSVQSRILHLLVIRPELHEKIEHLILHLSRESGTIAINLFRATGTGNVNRPRIKLPKSPARRRETVPRQVYDFLFYFFSPQNFGAAKRA